jgi:hypothetical protein
MVLVFPLENGDAKRCHSLKEIYASFKTSMARAIQKQKGRAKLSLSAFIGYLADVKIRFI